VRPAASLLPCLTRVACRSRSGQHRAGNSNLSPGACCATHNRQIGRIGDCTDRSCLGSSKTTDGAPDGRKGTKQKVARQAGCSSVRHANLISSFLQSIELLHASSPSRILSPPTPFTGRRELAAKECVCHPQAMRFVAALFSVTFFALRRPNNRRASNFAPRAPTWYKASASLRITATNARRAFSPSRAFFA
jgi:hypothetical protein